jgi:uncharacterized SAM-binding protein YcdF (DUF218 family)
MKFLKRCLCWCGALLLVAFALGLGVAKWVLEVKSTPRAAQVLVVLGGGPDDRPQKAVELLQKGYAPRLLLSGAGEEQFTLARLREAKVPAARLLLETNSTSTYENALRSVEVLRAQKITNAIIVTSWYHSRRALACFHKAAPEIKWQSAPSESNLTAQNLPDTSGVRFVAAEYAKLIWYAIKWRVFPWDAKT